MSIEKSSSDPPGIVSRLSAAPLASGGMDVQGIKRCLVTTLCGMVGYIGMA